MSLSPHSVKRVLYRHLKHREVLSSVQFAQFLSDWVLAWTSFCSLLICLWKCTLGQWGGTNGCYGETMWLGSKNSGFQCCRNELNSDSTDGLILSLNYKVCMIMVVRTKWISTRLTFLSLKINMLIYKKQNNGDTTRILLVEYKSVQPGTQLGSCLWSRIHSYPMAHKLDTLRNLCTRTPMSICKDAFCWIICNNSKLQTNQMYTAIVE